MQLSGPCWLCTLTGGLGLSPWGRVLTPPSPRSADERDSAGNSLLEAQPLGQEQPVCPPRRPVPCVSPGHGPGWPATQSTAPDHALPMPWDPLLMVGPRGGISVTAVPWVTAPTAQPAARCAAMGRPRLRPCGLNDLPAGSLGTQPSHCHAARAAPPRCESAGPGTPRAPWTGATALGGWPSLCSRMGLGARGRFL